MRVEVLSADGTLVKLEPFPVPLPDVYPPNINIGYTLVRNIWSWFGVATTAIALRFISKGLIAKQLAAEDVLMVAAWICSAITSACLQLAYHFGLGRHYEYTTLPRALSLLKYLLMTQYFSIAAPMLGRASFNVYLLAIVGKAKPRLRYLLVALLVVSVSANVALMLVLLIKCGTDLGEIINPNTTCYTKSVWSPYLWYTGAWNIITDFTLAVVPAWLVSKMNTTFRAKCAVAALLGLSTFAMFAATWRVIEISHLWSLSYDFTYNAASYFIATVVEMNLIMICSSVPTLGHLVKRLRQKYDGTLHLNGHDVSRQASTGNAELRRNLVHSLGMSLPVLGNTVTIMAGPAPGSQEQILALENLDPAMIKTTRQTIVNVECVQPGSSEGSEKMLRTSTRPSSDVVGERKTECRLKFVI